MSNFKNDIDKLVSRILNEEIENKVKQLSENMEEGEWTEIEVDEELHGNQKKLDVAPPKGKLTKADFDKLRRKKKEANEMFFSDDESDDDDFSERKTRRKFKPVKDFPEIPPRKDGGTFFDVPKKYRKDNDEIKSRRRGKMSEQETEEGNAFTGALAKAKEEGKDSFEFDGKKYDVKEMRDKFDGRDSKVIGVYSDIKKQREMKEEEKWIQKTDMNKGALHKKLGIPEDEKIPVSKLKSLKKELMKKGEGDKKLSAADSKLLKQVNLALTLKDIKETKKPSLKLTEDELIDMIEKIVLEQKTKDSAEKENINKKSPEGLRKTEKVLEKNKKENSDYADEVVKKMKDYMKDMFLGDSSYDENPDDFPQSNYDREKTHNEKKYNPSDAVDEYIEAFAYPGMTNLVYDEIKPNDEMIEKQIKGDSTNGNAVTDKDGKALGNVSKRSSKTGDRFKKNYDDNIYGAEQMNGSYKRVPQPVDTAGDKKQSGSLKKSQAILNKLESTEDKKTKMISEEMNKMKNLIGYDRKTQ